MGPRVRGDDGECARSSSSKIHISNSLPKHSSVIAGLDPAIHLLAKRSSEDGWMPGSSSGMTIFLNHNFAISPRFAPEFFQERPTLEKSEGAGNAGRPMRPQPRVRYETKHTSVVTTVTPEITRHSPRNGFNGFLRALPGDRACLPPSPCGSSPAKLDASVGASGPHDFAVRKLPFVQRLRA
jgi:hypothetical protein